MNESDTHDFEQKMQRALRSSEHELTPDVTRSLANARAAAMSCLDKPRSPRFFMPVTGMALASIVALVLVLSPDIRDNNAPGLTNDDLLLSETIDLYEDLEFYNWLASEDNNLNG